MTRILPEGNTPFAGISERQRTTMTLRICLHMAEVAGSILASLTPETLHSSGEAAAGEEFRRPTTLQRRLKLLHYRMSKAGLRLP
jgi:hypothetical protein